MRILVTGAEGFVGTRLVPALVLAGHTAEAAGFDLFDTAAVEARLHAAPWDCIVHLAAISHVPTCERDQPLAFRANLAGTAQLLEAVRRHSPRAWLVFASTAQVYAAPGADEHDVVIDEDRRIEPQSVYARTKWQAELVIDDAARRDGLRATVLRLFNHTHKSQSREFFLPHLYHAIVETPLGAVPVGNLDIWRDFGSIHDLVAAFAARLARPAPESIETFNICSGSAKRLADVAEELVRRLGARVELVTDPARVRAGEARSIAGSHRRFSAATGWEPHCATAGELVTAFLAD
jgi:GDP-4-dehydro-6-deoxy-D-mannose reductase